MMGWKTSTRVLVPDSAPEQRRAIFINTYTGICQVADTIVSIPPPCEWQLADLKPIGVPSDALAIDLREFLIITNGTKTITGDLAMSFQAPGAGWNPKEFAGQSVACGMTGSRTNHSAIVPCIDGCIEWAWLRGDSGKVGEWPDGPIPVYGEGASYGINATIQAIFLP